MNDVMEQIKTLSATLDEETTRFHPTGRLLLLSSYESVFLKAVKRKADLLGIDCDLTQYPCPPYKAVAVDRETVPSDIKLTAEVDIDHSYSQGMSSVSQATLALLLALDLVHAKDISYNTRDLVIDLGNSVPHPDRFNCPYVNRIGQLTVSVLLNRFARKEHRA